MHDVFTLSLDAPDKGSARLTLAGHLDDTAARDLLHTAATVVKCGCSRLVVDVDGLTGFDPQTAFALTGCARLGRYLSGGVAVVAGTPRGVELAEQAGVEPVAEQLSGARPAEV